MSSRNRRIHQKEMKHYTIVHPSTTEDDGSPSDDILHDCRRVLLLIEDERHLTAQKLYSSVMVRLEEHPGRNQDGLKAQRVGVLKRRKIKKLNALYQEEDLEILRFLETHKQVLETLEAKAALFRRALVKLNTSDDWILSQNWHGVATFYRKEMDGSLSIKMEGKMEGVPLFDQVAVIREVDLHRTWAPFCTSSATLKELNKCDTVGWFSVGAPQFGLMRDGIFRAVGCDCMADDGTFLIVGQGLHDRAGSASYSEPFLTEGLDSIQFPTKPTRLGTGRITIRSFSASIQVVSPTCCDTKIVANVDPHLPLPQSLLDFVTRKVCGVILHKLQGAARKISKNPARNSHARRMRQEYEFYKGWLLPKFQAFCKMQNWIMPKVAALELSEDDEEKELMYEMGAKESQESHAGDDESTSNVSPLTVTSSLAKNPIVRYLREAEAKTEAKKVLKIKASRQMAENRLKPKHLSEDQSIRLEELKDAKERRMLNNGTPIAAIEVENVFKKDPKRDSIFSQIQGHSLLMRFVTTTVLCCWLAVVLNPDIIWSEVLDSFYHPSTNWWSEVLFDCGAMAYITFCAFVHFVVCDVALLYSFSALDIGMKTGKLSKQYYGDTVRNVVALLSGSIVVFCTGKAVASALMRVLVWYSMLGVELSLATAIDIQRIIADVIPNGASDIVMSLFSNTFYALENATKIAGPVYNLVVKTNRFGLLLEGVVFFIFKLSNTCYIQWTAYQTHVRDMYEDTDASPCWRRDAIETTQVLLAYTTVFLLSSLILFNASSRANKRINNQWGLLVSKPLAPSTKNDAAQTFPMVQRLRSCDSCRTVDYSVSVIAESNMPQMNETKKPLIKLQLRSQETQGSSRSVRSSRTVMK